MLTHYETLGNGNTCKFSEEIPEFKLSYMKDQLNSDNPIGYGYMEFIGNIINKDIYTLDARHRDIYTMDELALSIKGNRKSIILFYLEGHFEMVGLYEETGIITHFNPEHELIRFLYRRVQEFLKR